MHIFVQIFSAENLHGWTELAAVFVLRCHISIGEDGKPDLWLRYGDTVGGHPGGLCSELLNTCTDLFAEVECEIDDLNKLAEDVLCCWPICAVDGALYNGLELVLIHALIIFAIK